MKSYWPVLALFLLWFSSMYFYMPLPLVVILFAAMVSGATVALWSAWMRRRAIRGTRVIKQDTRA